MAWARKPVRLSRLRHGHRTAGDPQQPWSDAGLSHKPKIFDLHQRLIVRLRVANLDDRGFRKSPRQVETGQLDFPGRVACQFKLPYERIVILRSTVSKHSEGYRDEGKKDL